MFSGSVSYIYLQEIEVTQKRIECETLNKDVQESRQRCHALVSDKRRSQRMSERYMSLKYTPVLKMAHGYVKWSLDLVKCQLTQ